jgi:hypothetical protein
LEQVSIFDTPTPDIPEKALSLPAQTTRFVGRSRELADIERLLAQPETRLLTLLGAGGMGKTRLAVEAAARQVENFADGVVFVDLAPVEGPQEIYRALAEALQLAFDHEGQYENQLIHFLGEKEILILLDNFELLVDASPFLSRLLAQAGRLKLLVTSRKRLHLSLEQILEIRGLALPDGGTDSPVDQADAVDLFVLHARRAQPDFQLAAEDLAHVTRICRQLEGMPLGIQLAASWIRALPIVDIADELQQDLDFLAREQHDIPVRQRSMRAVFKHSWNLLPPDNQDAFGRLSIFRGGFTLQAARKVTGIGIRALSSLVDHSLLSRTPEGRFTIHELMRQFGREILEESPSLLQELQEQHCRYFCSALQDWAHQLSSSRMIAAVEEIEKERSNLDTAWHYGLENKLWDALLDAVNGFGDFHDASGRWYEGLDLFRKNREDLSARLSEPLNPEAALLVVWFAAWQVNLDINGRGGLVDPQEAARDILEPALILLQEAAAHPGSLAAEAYLRMQLGRILKRIPGRLPEGQAHIERIMSTIFTPWGRKTMTWPTGASKKARFCCPNRLIPGESTAC